MRTTLSFIFITLLLSGCTEIEWSERVPLGERQRFFSRYESSINNIPWPTKVKDDTALTGPAGDFEYYEMHKDEAQTAMERVEMCNLKESQLAKMSTPNLIKTCYAYPYLLDIFLTNNEYYSALFIVSEQFNGFQELMCRKSAPAELIRDYRERRYADGWFRLSAWTFILFTAVDYGVFSADEVKELAAAIEEKIVDAYTSFEDLTGRWYSPLRQPYLLGAFLAYHHDERLTPEEVSVLETFINPPTIMNSAWIPGTPKRVNPETRAIETDLEAINTAIEIIIRSMERLK